MLWTYRITFDDFKAAQRLHLRQNRRARIIFLIFQRIMPVLAVFALGLLVWDIGFHHFSLSPWLGGVLFAVIWLGIYLPVMRPIQLRRGYKTMKNGRNENDPLELELTDTELISRVPGVAEGRLLPPAIKGFAEDDAVALVYLSQKTFLVLPRPMMPELQWSMLRQWLEQRNVRN